jgi:hypothetical protein
MHDKEHEQKDPKHEGQKGEPGKHPGKQPGNNPPSDKPKPPHKEDDPTWRGEQPPDPPTGGH